MSTGGYEGDAYIRDHQLLFLNQQLQQQQQQQQHHQHQQQQHVYHVYHPPQDSSSSSSAVIQDHSPSLIFPNIHGSSFRFTGYAGVLSRSIFLDPARQLLQETCDVSSGSVQGNLLGLQDVTDCGKMLDDSSMGKERQWKRTKLILDEVCRRYTHYYQQAQAVIQAFESVAGLSSAAPYVSMALQTMSKQFKCLENLISGQLRDLTNKAFGKEVISEEVVPSFRMTNCGVCGPIMANNVAFKQQPLWRPQRRLPERAVGVLRKWLFEHFLHPYPTEIDKQMLAKQTGLSRNQVSNWFINARVRLWKPMVEEVESLKLSQSHQFSAGDRNKNANEQPHVPPLDFIATQSDNQTNVNACHWKNQYPTPKPFRSDLSQITHKIAEPRNFASNEISSHHVIGTGSSAAGRRNGGVTLTLGLHQSNEDRIHEPLNLNAVCSFDFDYSDTTVNIAMDSFRRYL